jgi:arsenite methyltransferase
MAKAPDRWHRWLLDVRFGGDPAARERLLTEHLYPVRDTVLDKAKLQPGDTVLDVGTGDGLIAFGALERLGPSGHVVFSDISQDLLDHCRAAAAAEGLLDRCRFVLASADSLADVADTSVDVVTVRSVLIYVKDKAEALRAFYRVLRPGGRIRRHQPRTAGHREGRQAAGSLGTCPAHVGKPASTAAGRGPGPGVQPAGDRRVHRACQAAG